MRRTWRSLCYCRSRAAFLHLQGFPCTIRVMRNARAWTGGGWPVPTLEENRAPFSHRSGATGVLLIHGFTGSPGELRPLAEAFAGAGFAVEVPVLAGHCRTIEEMNRTRYRDWMASGLGAYRDLRARTSRVAVYGHSMGALIALQLAAAQDVWAVVAAGAPMYLKNRHARLAGVAGVFWPVMRERVPENPMIDPYLGGYRGMTPVRAAGSLVRFIGDTRRVLPRVTAPVLVQQGRLDLTVRPESAHYIYNRIASRHKLLQWYERSGHMLTVDAERERVWRDAISFVQSLEGERRE